MRIKFLGGCREVGRSAVLVDDILLDYGFKPSHPIQFPLDANAEEIILSHAHLDHSGLIPALANGATIYMTPPTKELAALLAYDTIRVAGKRKEKPPYGQSAVERMEKKARLVAYERSFSAGEYDVTFYDASHIPGSASIHLAGEKSLFYCGDINPVQTRLLKELKRSFPESDVLIIESTYFGTDHTPRFDLEIKFVDSIMETIDGGGHVIIPCFAVGRTQEVLLILHNFGLTPYLDGMGADVTEILLRYPRYLRDARKLEEAYENAVLVDPERRAEVLQNPSIIVTTAGMLEGGPVLYYLQKLKDDARSKLMLTGYQVEGTNGRLALEEGCVMVNGDKVKLGLGIEQYDFSAHAGDRELREVVDVFCRNGTEYVFAVHGDRSEEFAKWIRENYGCDAFAPTMGEEFVL